MLMRFKMTMLLFFVSIAALSVAALGIDWDNPGNDADAMISSGETTTITPPEGQAATPKLSRDQQANKSSLDWSMPSTLSGSSDSAKESRASAESSSQESSGTDSEQAGSAVTNATTTADTELPPATSEPMSAQGNWYFALNDTVKRDLVVTIFQNGTDIYGAGKIKEGNSTVDVAVSGAVENTSLELNLVSTNPITQYKLELQVDGDWAFGEYQASSAGGESWSGTAEGQKTS